VNIKESNDAFTVEVAAPGFDKSDFKLELNHDLLTISSEKQMENETKEDEQFTRREFSYQAFTRTFTLPNTVEEDKIKATYDNGILKISIPKKKKLNPNHRRLLRLSNYFESK